MIQTINRKCAALILTHETIVFQQLLYFITSFSLCDEVLFDRPPPSVSHNKSSDQCTKNN